MRQIDADALIKDIAESVRYVNEWEKESHEKKDEQGLKCAIETRRALQAMISRLAEAPAIELERKKGHINICNGFECCSECGNCLGIGYTNYCGYCGAELEV